MSRKDKEKNDVDKSISISSNLISTNRSIKETEKKFKFDKYDRSKFDSNAKQKTKEMQFSTGEKQFDPISGEEIVQTQQEAKQLWGDDWAKHSAEGDHIDPLKRVYEKGNDMPFVKEADVKEVANQDSNFIAVSKETNTRKGDKTNEEFVDNPKYNYSSKGKEKAIELQKEAEATNNEKLKQKNVGGIKETLSSSAQRAAINASFTTAVFSGVNNAKLVKDGKKDVADAILDTAKDTTVATGKAVLDNTSSTLLTQTAKYSKSKLLRGLAENNIIAYSLHAAVEVGPDLYKAAISKSISWTQVGKNFSVVTATIAGAAGGAVGGTKAGATIGTAVAGPGAGTAAGAAVGEVVGTFVGGTVGAKTAKALTDLIAKDDAELMTNVMNQRVAELAAIYELSSDEFERYVLPEIQKRVDGKWLVEMFKASGRDNTAKQYLFVDKAFIEIYDNALRRKNIIKRVLISLKVSKLKVRCGLPKTVIEQALPILGVIISVILLIILCLFFFKKCYFGKIPTTEKSSIIAAFSILGGSQKQTPQSAIAEEQKRFIPSKIEMKKIKSFEFHADRRDFVNPDEAEIWLDSISKEMKDLLRQDSNLKFKICGYVAEFTNEIDDKILSQERADVIKKKLVKRGIPSKQLITVPMGKTTQWGTERKLNRVVTIESFKE